jgi:hypothetical protein
MDVNVLPNASYYDCGLKAIDDGLLVVTEQTVASVQVGCM